MAAEKVLCIADLQKAASQILPVATRGNECLTQDLGSMANEGHLCAQTSSTPVQPTK